jgi:cyclic pyranopterin phosphate synthase
MSDLTHFNARGEAHMVDVGEKPATHRMASAEGRILAHPETLRLIREGSHRKGDVLGVARVAGIMAAKKTADLVPLCHPLALTRVTLDLDVGTDAVRCVATVETRGPTGVEMEALCAVSIAAVTVYDMCKSVDRAMVIDRVRLEEKSGGRSGHFLRKD